MSTRKKPQPRPTVKLRLEQLEDRSVPTTFSGAGDGSWTDPNDWVGGKVPTDSDPAFFVATNNVACYIPAGISVACSGLSIASGYTKTITLDSSPGPVHLNATLTVSGLAALDGGTIDQQSAGCTVTLGGGTWDGTKLNSTTTLSDIYLNGNLTVKGGATTLGSNLYVQNLSTVDWQATTNDVTVNNAAIISVNAGSTLSFSGDSSTGLSTTIKAANGSSYLDNYGLVQRTSTSLNDEVFGMPMKVESGGRLWLQDRCNLEIDGSNASTSNVSLYQVGGTTDLDDLSYLTLGKGAYATAGYFESLGLDATVDLVNAGTQLKISGTARLLVCAGNNTTYGTFSVIGSGDVNLDGGTFVVYGKVGTGYDKLICFNNIMINSAVGGCTLCVYTTGAPVAGDGTDWRILEAGTGKSITGDFNPANFNWNGGYNWNHKNNTTTYDLTP